MVQCKNVGGGLGDEDPRCSPCLSATEKDKGPLKTTTKKKCKRYDVDTERAIAVAEATERAERGGHSGALWIGDTLTLAQRRALERAEARHGSAPRTIMLGGRCVSLEDTAIGIGITTTEGAASQGETAKQTQVEDP